MAPKDVGLDQRIGRNIAELRGPWTQARLAQLMTARGVPWTPSIVSNIENGTRSLQFSESFALASVLGVSHFDLISKDVATIKQLHHWVSVVNQSEEGVMAALREWANARLQVAGTADVLLADGQQLRAIDKMNARSMAETTVMELFDRYRLELKVEIAKNQALYEDYEDDESDENDEEGDDVSNSAMVGMYMKAYFASQEKEQEWAMSRTRAPRAPHESDATDEDRVEINDLLRAGLVFGPRD